MKKKISALIKLLEADLPSLSSENTYLETLEQADGETAKKREAFDAFREKVHRQDGIYEENKIHLQDQCKEREKEIGALQEKIRRLESNILVFPAEVENARNKIQERVRKTGYPDRGPHFCRIGPVRRPLRSGERRLRHFWEESVSISSWTARTAIRRCRFYRKSGSMMEMS
ncbi:MAG: hypothetical protein ACLR8P_01305 [Clostridium fessum]